MPRIILDGNSFQLDFDGWRLGRVFMPFLTIIARIGFRGLGTDFEDTRVDVRLLRPVLRIARLGGRDMRPKFEVPRLVFVVA